MGEHERRGWLSDGEDGCEGPLGRGKLGLGWVVGMVLERWGEVPCT